MTPNIKKTLIRKGIILKKKILQKLRTSQIITQEIS